MRIQRYIMVTGVLLITSWFGYWIGTTSESQSGHMIGDDLGETMIFMYIYRL